MSYNKTNQKISPAPEILGAILSSEANATELQSNAKSYLYSHYNADLPNVDVNVVVNESDSVHLILPYYNGIGDAAQEIADRDIDDIVGGEIGFTVAAIIATGILFAGVTTGGALLHDATSGK